MTNQTSHSHYPIWDIWIRLFHWALVILIATSWLSVELGNMEVHRYSGYAMLTLLLFRVIWGFVGSRHARFSDFVRGPRAVLAYLLQQDKSLHTGHNPLGAWSVMTLLALLGMQVGTGLFATDDILFEGPYYAAVSSDTAGWLTSIHKSNFKLLLVFIVLHVGAILYYYRFKQQNLITAMVRGRSATLSGLAPGAPWWRGLVIFGLSLGAVAAFVSLAPESSSYF